MRLAALAVVSVMACGTAAACFDCVWGVANSGEEPWPGPPAQTFWTVFEEGDLPPGTLPSIPGGPVPYEGGVVFQINSASAPSGGYIHGVKWWKDVNEVGTHHVSLWDAAGSNMYTEEQVGETASGWQTQLFTTPRAVVADTTYIASAYKAYGVGLAEPSPYSFDGTEISNGPIRFLANDDPDVGAGQGRRSVTGVGVPTYPDLETGASGRNQFIDIVFSESQ